MLTAVAPSLDELYKHLGRALKAAREEAGMSAQQLADQLGVTDLTVYRWESGGRRIDLDVLQRIHGVLGLRKGELLRAAGVVDEGRLVDLDALPPELRRVFVTLLRDFGHDIPGDRQDAAGGDA